MSLFVYNWCVSIYNTHCRLSSRVADRLNSVIHSHPIVTESQVAAVGRLEEPKIHAGCDEDFDKGVCDDMVQ